MDTSPDVGLEVDLPLIDVSRFVQAPHDALRQEALANVRHACQEWGFFRIINHGIPESLLQDVELTVQQVYSTPENVRHKAMISFPSRSGREMFAFPNPCHSDSVFQMSHKLWPQDGNPFFWYCMLMAIYILSAYKIKSNSRLLSHCSKTIETYTLFLEDLTRTITKIILASLGLDVDNYYQSDFQNCTSTLRINLYTYDGKSVDEDPLFAHTDLGVFTILYQDDKGGLQIRSKQGIWFNVKPLPHSFVINIADCFKAWSNGKYRSAEHRVVYRGWVDRISVGYFIRFPSEKEIWAPPELVDDCHPRRYRPFTFSQLRDVFIERQHSDEEKVNFVDKYAGV